MTYLQRMIEGVDGEMDMELAIQQAIQEAMMAPYGNRCYLPVEHSLSCPSIIRAFSNDFIAHYRRRCQGCRDLVLPKIHDFDETMNVLTSSPGRLTR